MKLAIMKPVFTIIMFICCFILTQSIIMDDRYRTIAALKAVAKIDPEWFPESVNQLIRLSCENKPNSFNASISNIDFISSPLISCLNLTDKLIVLNLNNNHFNCISNYQFQVKQCLSMAGLKDLQYLSVSTNNIRSIESTAFQDNNKLVYLNLSVNNIRSLHPDTFANLQYLKQLDLSQNELENVPQISNEIGITSLYINNNNITKLMSNVFAQMPKLTKLWLRGNQINEIDVEAFANLPVLWELDLSRNKLSVLPEGWTKSLASLQVMDLSDNQFTSLESLSLTNAPIRSLFELIFMNLKLD